MFKRRSNVKLGITLDGSLVTRKMKKMMKNKLFTLLLMVVSFNDFKNASGMFDFNATIALNASHNVNCILKIMRENFKRNTTVTMFSSNNAELNQLESDLIKNVFNSVNCSVVLYTQMTHNRVM